MFSPLPGIFVFDRKRISILRTSTLMSFNILREEYPEPKSSIMIVKPLDWSFAIVSLIATGLSV